ncbi:MAG: CHASE2 domain-containing protein [Fibrobacter sp.]|nr:CHASE2 domain-containing protein [Fibrobacter sp.]
MQIKISKKVKKVASGFGISALIVVLILIFGSTQNDITGLTRNGAESLENIFYDLFFKGKTSTNDEEDLVDEKVSLENNSDPNIIIVDIDEPSLAKLGPYNEWDRSIHANVVKHLNEGGAAAIGFDILLKNADFGSKKATQVDTLLSKISPDNNWDTLKPSIKAFFNYDSMLVSAIQDGGISIVCNMFDDAKSYKHESQWRPLSSQDRVEEIGYGSVIKNSQVDKVNQIEPKDLLDNIFPELARAGAKMGSVNAYPDNDGVVRRVSMLYRFPSPELYPDEPSNVYSTMSLMTVMHLYGQKPENIEIKMGQYINLGKPFGIYRDAKGEYHTTYPNFSYPMFQALRERLKAKDIQKNASKDFIDVSSKILVKKNDSGEISMDIFEGQSLNSKFTQALIELDEKTLDSLENKITLPNGLTIGFDEDDDSKKRFVLADPEEDEEIIFNRYILNTVHYFQDSIQKIPAGKWVHLSLDMDLRYDKSHKRWRSNQVILSDSVIRDIQQTEDAAIESLKAGDELRFGPVKKIPIDKYGRYQVNYKGHYKTAVSQRTFQHLSYYDVSYGRVDPSMYQGKIFILGSAAAALFDFVPGPHEENYPAVLIHATIIKNILEGDYVVTLEEHKQQIIVILLALFSLLIGLYFKSNISVPISVIVMIIYTGIAYYYFTHGLYIGVSKPLAAMLLIDITTLVLQFYFENKEKKFINDVFKQYISPELIDDMVKNEIMPTLGGQKSNITAYFTDIASFSTFSEKIGDPSKLVELLNEYLTAMTDTLLGNKGTLDKYEGDAIIAFFGAPMPLPNHAQSACDAAVGMQSKLMKLRKKWASEGNKWPKVVHDMHMRIGINSGDIVTGNMGSTMRKNYTMMGDAVNLAARLESAAKQYGAYIQMSEDTQKNLEPGKFIYRSLDTVRVVGKSQPVKTFELLEHSGCANEKQLLQLVEIWEQARQCYLDMKWDEAIQLFTKCLDYEPHHPDRDPGSKSCPSLVYIKRCEDYKQNPPVPAGEKWDGIFTATSK